MRKTESGFNFVRSGSRPLVVAHRGASSTHPENTLPAFEAAIGAGAEIVEFDVRLTRDGVPVVLHDASVARTTDGHGLVRNMDLAELKRLRAGSPQDAAEVPTLREALDLLDGRAGADIEIKNLPGDPDYIPDGEPSVDATLGELASGFAGPVLVSSFNPASIGHARRAMPEIATGLLVVGSFPLDDALALAIDHGHTFVLPSTAAAIEAGPGLCARAHRDGIGVGVWVVDDPGSVSDVVSLGVDAIATNDPAAIVRALDRAERA
ncbi:MAG: glycerophosphodiester phosphodiesterase [Actinomycetota bacterium]